MRRILVNTAVSRSRSEAAREVPTDALPEGAVDEPGVESRLELWDLLRELSPRQRAVLALRYYEDLSEAQIAEALGCSTGAVKSHASRALAQLRRVLVAEGREMPDRS